MSASEFDFLRSIQHRNVSASNGNFLFGIVIQTIAMNEPWLLIYESISLQNAFFCLHIVPTFFTVQFGFFLGNVGWTEKVNPVLEIIVLQGVGGHFQVGRFVHHISAEKTFFGIGVKITNTACKYFACGNILNTATIPV